MIRISTRPATHPATRGRPHVRASLAAAALALIAPLALRGQDRPIVPPVERFFATPGKGALAAGELLLGELLCVNCHGVPGDLTGRVLQRSGPVLDGAGSRLQASWVLDYLTDPRATDPGTIMPDLLAGVDPDRRRPVIRSLMHFLASLEAPLPAVEGEPSAERGERLFHRVGCVACHAPGRSYTPSTLQPGVERARIVTPSAPLVDLESKYTFAGLVAFLRDPLSVRPSGRMPHIALEPDEARDVAFYLREGSRRDPPPLKVDRALAGEGARHFAELGCAACHRATRDEEPIASRLDVVPFDTLIDVLGTLVEGCLGEEAAPAVPWYGLDRRQRVLMRVALEDSIGAEPLEPPEILERSLMALGCLSCHERNGRGGPDDGRSAYFEPFEDDIDLGDEGRFPPRLTGTGAKLRRDALNAIVAGRGAVRPYLATRMPSYGEAHASAFAELFAIVDPPVRPSPPERVGRNMWGRELVGIDGLGCVVCHDFHGRPGLGSRAIDLATSPARLRPEWFHEYLIDPARFVPGTRMPTYWPEGEAVNRRIVGGDTVRQIDSIWVYLLESDQTRPPAGLEARGTFELAPRERPIVFRTFMKHAGMHAIAIGFPGGVHVAFDARQVRMAIAWKGKFLDAESTWDNRFTPLAAPLGEDLVAFPPGPLLAALESADAAWPESGHDAGFRMRGYRLDSRGVPTLLYSAGAIDIEDRVEPLEGHAGLLRTVRLVGVRAPVWMRIASGDRVRVEVTRPPGAVPRRSGDESRLLITPSADPIDIGLRMTW